jgi:hypothetical protein
MNARVAAVRSLLVVLACSGVCRAQVDTSTMSDADVRAAVAKMQPAIDRAIDRGVEFLLSVQLRDGNFPHDDRTFATGQTALAVYTFLKAGLGNDHPAVRRGLAAMAQRRPLETYTAGCHLLAYAATGDATHLPQMRRIVADLLDWQRGTFGYPNEDGRLPGLHRLQDLSCTQYSALGLLAAQQAGVDVPRSAWLEMVSGTLRCQRKPSVVDVPSPPADASDGRTNAGTAAVRQEAAGFSYTNVDRDAYASMTTAGIAVLAIAQKALGDRLPPSVAQECRRGIDLGLAWLATNFSVTENPGRGQAWLYYHLYGLERVGALLGRSRFGARAWYLEGAQMLIGKQSGNGDWTQHHPEPDTCFGVLFLARATAPATGGRRQIAALGPQGDRVPVWLKVSGGADGTPTQLWIAGFGKSIRDAKPRIDRVEYRVDGVVVATVPGDPTKTWTHEGYPARHVFDRRGKRTVDAVVHFTGGDDAALREVASAPIAIDVRQALEAWMLDYSQSAGRNLMLRAEAVATASSQHDDGHAPANAVDGREGARWFCAADDAAPTLAIRLDRPQTANTLVLAQGESRPRHLGEHDVVRRVAVRINGGKPFDVNLDPDELTPTVVTLERAIPIRRIDIAILDRSTGSRWPGLAGFAEVRMERRAVGK